MYASCAYEIYPDRSSNQYLLVTTVENYTVDFAAHFSCIVYFLFIQHLCRKGIYSLRYSCMFPSSLPHHLVW